MREAGLNGDRDLRQNRYRGGETKGAANLKQKMMKAEMTKIGDFSSQGEIIEDRQKKRGK